MDIGCYAISLSRWLFEAEPTRIMGRIEYDPRFHIDRTATAILEFATGASTFTCSTQLSPHQRVQIAGDRGRIEIEIPFNAPPDRPCRLWLEREKKEEIEFPTCDQYTLQGDGFSQCALNGTAPPTPLEDAVANMRVIEGLFESAKRDAWVTL
jgi:predicted dehydrogenase